MAVVRVEKMRMLVSGRRVPMRVGVSGSRSNGFVMGVLEMLISRAEKRSGRQCGSRACIQAADHRFGLALFTVAAFGGES